MAKPTTVITWATDAGATSDPGPTRRASGFIAGKKLPAKWLNWLFSQNAQWLTYLRDLHTEPEFLSKAYSWSGMHRFVSAYITNNFGVNGEMLYVNDAGGIAPRERTVQVSLASGLACAATPGAHLASTGNNYWSWDTLQTVAFPLSLPSGSELTGFSCTYTNNSQATTHVTCNLYVFAPNEGEPFIFGGGGNPDPAPGETVKYENAAVNIGIGNAMNDVQIRFTANGGRLDVVEFSYLDPGPRNY
jgi:hypothetical protein